MSLRDQEAMDDKLLDKATIEAFLVSNFKMIYGEEEVDHMENTLKKHFRKKYPKNDDLFEFYNKIENAEKENEEEINAVKEEFCKSHTMKRAKSHDPKSLLLLARFFNAIGDCRLASECLWGSADMAVKKFIDKQGLGGVRGLKLVSHVAKERFVKEACDLEKEFDTIAKYHRNFYTDEYNRHDVGIGIGHAEAFVNRLEGYGEIDAAKKAELKRTDFNSKDYRGIGN